ncbi:trypsin-like peptidase domain-containing protein [Tessaracoccus sp. OS52]|uniref:S1C family serine protease n=1 Tax=Tessaracoccus sp. OS52 TaxID=2886691 RepID=UPI001D11602E|nr:trypsin-like peptidase domain-containing protein [Tessaracoccus sp. OS52]MCC2594262.1 trypsin-like peptidase domain-containing protein [Tessaracoccus sp. OS52]
MTTTPNNRPEFQPSAPQPWQGQWLRDQGGAGTQPMPTVPRELGSPAPPPPAQPATYAPAQAFTARPRKRRTLAGIVALAVMAVAGGGAVGAVTTSSLLDDNSTSSGASVTQVVQADPSNPDWSATAAAVSDAVVAIQVAGPGGSGQGSGVILDAEGHIVTNNHVVAGAGSGGRITVVIGTTAHEAEIVGLDPSTDLAVIRLVDPPQDLETISFADLSTLEVGDPVMAVGNPLGLSDTVTTGIVSALDRPVATPAVSSGMVGDSGNGMVVTAAIQTSAAINPGNSGGALVNASGELVGITSSIATLTNSSGQSGNIGIGFAIPVNQVRNVVDQLITNGVAQHAQLGVSASDVEGSSQLGAQVADVVPGSAAAEAGIRQGDVIIALDDRPIVSSEALVALIRSSAVGEEVELTIVRSATGSGEPSQETVTATLTAATN